MEKRYEPIVLQLRAEGLGLLERCPWLELHCVIDDLAPSFFAWPQFLERDGSHVHEFRHAELIFPADEKDIVMIAARTDYGEEVIQDALWLIYERHPSVNVRLSLA